MCFNPVTSHASASQSATHPANAFGWIN
jgi:hypothetical protein